MKAQALVPALALAAALLASPLAEADGRHRSERGGRPPAQGYYGHRPSHGSYGHGNSHGYGNGYGYGPETPVLPEPALLRAAARVLRVRVRWLRLWRLRCVRLRVLPAAAAAPLLPAALSVGFWFGF